MVPSVKSVGYLTFDEFVDVCLWKSPRPKPRYVANEREHVEEVTSIALRTSFEKLRTGALLVLDGVDYPLASTLLHWFHTDQYPIVDVYALKALGFAERTWYNHKFWATFVKVWREKLKQSTVEDARTFDRALWQWGKNQTKDL